MLPRPLIVVLAFLFAVTASEVAVRAVSNALPDPAPWPSIEAELKARQLERDGNYDIIFFGTSVTEAAVDAEMVTEELGREAYNAALPFASQAAIRTWAEHFVLPNTDPDLLVVGIPLWSAGFASGVESGRMYAGLRSVVEFRSHGGLFDIPRRLALVRWRSELKSIANRLSPLHRPEDSGLWTDRGHQTLYYERVATHSAVRLRTPTVETAFGFGPLVELSALARSEGVGMVFLLEPGTCDAGGACLPADDADVLRSAYTRLGEELGVPVIEVQGPWPAEWYADGAHFNRTGTVAYTSELVEALKGLGV